jgi:hypothetical protein
MNVTNAERATILANQICGCATAEQRRNDVKALLDYAIAAEQRGYLRGVEDAAQAGYDRIAPSADLTDPQLTSWGLQRRIAASQVLFAIRALAAQNERLCHD